MENLFPLRTTKRCSTDPPWINGTVKKMIKRRKAIFKENEAVRTKEWKEMKKKTVNLIEKRCKKYQESQKEQLLANNGGRSFF